jgi:ParB-like chromosome segregation protein Spo0J
MAELGLGQAHRSLADLHEAADNPRQITDERFEALKYALSKDPDMLEARPIICLPNGEVVAGNMRLRAAKDLGWTEVPIYVADLNSSQRREWMLRDNQEYGDWVPDELAALIRAHREAEGDMALLGFSEPSLDSLLKSTDEDERKAKGDDGPTGQAEVWGVIVECESEESQAEVLDELAERGFEVRALLPA